MQQQFVVTHRNAILQEAQEVDQSVTDQHLNTLCFYENIRAIIFLWTQNVDSTSIKRKVGISERHSLLLAYLVAHADKRHHFVCFPKAR